MQSDPIWLLIACLLLGIGFFIGSIRWWFLLRVQGILLPLKVTAALTLIGQFFNAFLLGTTGGDIVKIFYITQYAPQKKAEAALTVLVDRILGLFVLLCCVLATFPWQLSVLIQHEETRAICYALLILFAGILAICIGLARIPFERLPSFVHQLWNRIPRRDILEALLWGFRQHGQSALLTLWAMVSSIFIWFIIFTAGYFVALALHLDVTYAQILTAISIALCVTALPISIGGHGVREGVFVLVFSVFGIIKMDQETGAGQEPAVLFSILFFALFLVWSLVGGLAYLTSDAIPRKIPKHLRRQVL